MVDIGKTDNITNLWPANSGRAIVESGHKKNSSKDQRRNKKQKDKNTVQDGPGKNIDEYA